MMKKSLALAALLTAVISAGTVCEAKIIPAYGPGQIGYTGAVLCSSLSVRQEASADSEVVGTLNYGDRLIVMEQKDGWAQFTRSDAVDAGPEGWVNASFVAIDPAWYSCDAETVVYAWNDTAAYQIGVLDAGTVLPVLKDDGDWLVVSLRGASGWIRKTDADKNPAAAQSSDSAGQSQSGSQSTSGSTAAEDTWYTVYAPDLSSVSIHNVGGSMFEDGNGRSYVNQDTGVFYCITSDVTYYLSPDAAAGSMTGRDYGEGAGLEDNWADYNNGTSSSTGADYGEGAGLEDMWAGVNSGNGEGAGLEDNWADYNNSTGSSTGADYGEGAGLEDMWANAN